MKKIRVPFITVLLFLTLLFSGCGSSPADVTEEKKDYPKSQEVINNLEENGYQVETFDTFEELGINTTRIKAVKDEEYLDVCYDVSSTDELNEIIEFYSSNYKKYNLISNVDMVFCYSSEVVIENSGLQISK